MMKMSSTPKKSLKIFINSVEAIGHQNACIGLGQALINRGHKVYYLISEPFRGQMEKYGFIEIVFASETKEAPSNDNEKAKNPIKARSEFLLASGLLGPASPLEKLKTMSNEAFAKDMYDKSIAQSGQMGDAIERVKPDLFIQDHFLIQPVVLRANIPFVSIFSGCPLFLYNEPTKIPPTCSGYSTLSDPSTWTEFNAVFQGVYLPIIRKYQKMFYEHFEYEPPQETEEEKKRNFPLSPYLNIYAYPKELDFQDIVPLPNIVTQIDAFCRDEAHLPFTLPENFVQPGEKLIYVSMGSMGSIDVELMKRLLSMFAKCPHKFIVSKGPRHDEYELPANCWGEPHLPQTAILPLVDLVITHGGNNTFTESFTFGKPMIVLPLFVDQYDNGQRIVDKGLGAQFEPYTCTERDLIGAIDRLLADSVLAEKLRNISNRIKTDNSKERACEIIENLVY